MFDARAFLLNLDSAGVHVEVKAGDILLSGNRPAIAAHLPEIRAHKPELVACLTQAANAPEDVTPHRLWLITRPEGQRFSSSFTPPKTRAEVQALYPEAEIEVETR